MKAIFPVLHASGGSTGIHDYELPEGQIVAMTVAEAQRYREKWLSLSESARQEILINRIARDMDNPAAQPTTKKATKWRTIE